MKITILLLALLCSTFVFSEPFPAIADKTAGMKKHPGFFICYQDERNGKIWLEIDRWNEEFLYVNWMPGGLGSNDVGLDRGKPGDTRIVKFIRSGPKVLLIQPNYNFRAITENPAELRTVRESFAESVLGGFQVAAEDGERVLVDATAFFLQDTFEVVSTLKETKQGDFKLDESTSTFAPEGTKNFPQNTEIEVMLTFAGDAPGEFVRDVTPTPKAITLRQRHSFVAAPGPGYSPRRFDPRAGFYGIRFMDFATPVGGPLWTRWIARHRLKKKDASGEVVEPIVYYVDSGAPEPVRSALVEGASWWNQAFEAAGFKNAFEVKILPPDADPLDIRYNVIQWVHRLTRGWSYGSTIVDPRTGEIIKGHVSLGSQRVRQDYMIAEGLLAPHERGKTPSQQMLELSLARIRQLSAHEVGHTLGLTHNFAASMNGRASVMDYPHPAVKIREDESFDLSDAYAHGIGDWDKVAIHYGYGESDNPGSEDEMLNGILADSIRKGLLFIADEDARPDGGANPVAHLWDNGSDPVLELHHILRVRRLALSRFTENVIQEGIPLATLEETLVPVYLFHRYQVIAVAKLLGGLSYNYSVRGDGQPSPQIVPPDQQRKALDALLLTLEPETLALPDAILSLIPPRPFGFPRWRETFPARTGVTLDSLAPPENAANIVIYLLLHPQRAARLVEYNARNPQVPGLRETIDKLIAATWKKPAGAGYPSEIRRVVNMLTLYYLMNLGVNDQTSPQARAIAFSKLDQLKNWLVEQHKTLKDENQKDHFQFAIAEIVRFEKDPKQIKLTTPLDPPPGAPIGCE